MINLIQKFKESEEVELIAKYYGTLLNINIYGTILKDGHIYYPVFHEIESNTYGFVGEGNGFDTKDEAHVRLEEFEIDVLKMVAVDKNL